MKKTLLTIAVFLVHHINLSVPSIAGVTYMDHFDFESRYRNVYECDPFYYHPLHLPEKCAAMYEQLIRSRVARNGPARIFKERSTEKLVSNERCSEETKDTDSEGENLVYNVNYQVPQLKQNVYVYNRQNPVSYAEQIVGSYAGPFAGSYARQYPAPYAGLMEVLDREAARSPVAPTFAVLPYIGPVALYRQPIGKEGRKLVEKWSRRYTHTDDETNSESLKYYGRLAKEMDLNGTNPIAAILNATRNMKPENVKIKEI